MLHNRSTQVTPQRLSQGRFPGTRWGCSALGGLPGIFEDHDLVGPEGDAFQEIARSMRPAPVANRAGAVAHPGSQHVELAAWRGRVEAVLDQPADHPQASQRPPRADHVEVDVSAVAGDDVVRRRCASDQRRSSGTRHRRAGSRARYGRRRPRPPPRRPLSRQRPPTSPGSLDRLLGLWLPCRHERCPKQPSYFGRRDPPPRACPGSSPAACTGRPACWSSGATDPSTSVVDAPGNYGRDLK